MDSEGVAEAWMQSSEIQGGTCWNPSASSRTQQKIPEGFRQSMNGIILQRQPRHPSDLSLARISHQKAQQRRVVHPGDIQRRGSSTCYHGSIATIVNFEFVPPTTSCMHMQMHANACKCSFFQEVNSFAILESAWDLLDLVGSMAKLSLRLKMTKEAHNLISSHICN